MGPAGALDLLGHLRELCIFTQVTQIVGRISHRFCFLGNLVRLSQQALMDCSWGFGNNGCDGGEDFRVYQWMIKHGGIPTEASYGPYLGQDGYCNLNKSTMGLKIKGWVNVTSGDVSGLKVAIAANGPVSVAIDAAHKSLSFYSNGVYYEEDCNNDIDGLDHAVLAVGYGEILGMVSVRNVDCKSKYNYVRNTGL